MVRIVVSSDQQPDSVLEGADGLTLMEVIRDSGAADMLALCGGTCNCATCVVEISPDGLGRLPAPAGTEKELLDTLELPHEGHRLACQIVLRNELDGIRVRVVS